MSDSQRLDEPVQVKKFEILYLRRTWNAQIRFKDQFNFYLRSYQK